MLRSARLGARFRRAEGALPLVLGHRGARHAAPENTLKSFELARAEGAAGIELDVRLDGDQNLVVLHDPTLERVTSGAAKAHAEELSTGALRSLDVGEGERVPLLREVLDWAATNDFCVNIEIKSDVRRRRALIERVTRELAGHARASERLLLSSFDPRFVFALSRNLPEFAVSWLVHDRQRILKYALGFRSLGASGVNPQHTLLSCDRVRRLKRQGAIVGTWTVNDPKLAIGYSAFGLDMIISDCPGKIRHALLAWQSTPAA